MHKFFIIAALAAATAFGVVGTFVSPNPAVAAQDHKHGEGEKHKLGRKVIGGYTVSVILIGEVEQGRHVDFDIKLIDAKPDPKALRVWVGIENSEESEKAEGKKGKSTYTGEVSVPKPLPKESKLWVELDTDDGLKSGWFDYDKHDHKH